jgi:hypothetical protein
VIPDTCIKHIIDVACVVWGGNLPVVMKTTGVWAGRLCPDHDTSEPENVTVALVLLPTGFDVRLVSTQKLPSLA